MILERKSTCAKQSTQLKKGAKQITKHPLEIGHRRIGYIGSRMGKEGNKKRHRGLPRRPSGRSHLAFRRSDITCRGSLDRRYRGMKQLFTTRRAYSRILFRGVPAYGACKAIRDAGLRKPPNVSLAGFDPPLTTIRQSMCEMG
jgi:LacI family transcriptional regulator